MKNNNKHLQKINENVGGDAETNKTNNHYLREIAKNTGSNLPSKHCTDNYYLKEIEENTAGGGGGGDCSRYIAQIRELEGEVSELEGNVSTLTEQKTELENEVSELEGDISDLEDELETTKDQRDNNIVLIDVDKLCPDDTKVELIAIVTENGNKAENVKVEFYEEEIVGDSNG